MPTLEQLRKAKKKKPKIVKLEQALKVQKKLKKKQKKKLAKPKPEQIPKPESLACSVQVWNGFSQEKKLRLIDLINKPEPTVKGFFARLRGKSD